MVNGRYVHGDRILSEFEESVCIVASESQKDNYQIIDYNDASQRVNGCFLQV